MKKVLISLTIIPIITLLLSVNILAETVYTEGALNYVIRDGVVVITKYFGTDSTVTIPSSINNTPVVEIAKGAFVDTKAENIIIPDTVVNIDEGAIPSDIKYDIVDQASTVDHNEQQENIDTKDETNKQGQTETDKNKDKDKTKKQEESNTPTKDKTDEIEINTNEDGEKSDFEPSEIDSEIVESGDVDTSIDEDDTQESIINNVTTKESNNTSIYIVTGFGVILLCLYIYRKRKNVRN